MSRRDAKRNSDFLLLSFLAVFAETGFHTVTKVSQQLYVAKTDLGLTAAIFLSQLP